MLLINRIVWIGVFIAGSLLLIIFDWMDQQQGNVIGWFLLTSVWSAVCGIGFSVCNLILQSIKRD